MRCILKDFFFSTCKHYFSFWNLTFLHRKSRKWSNSWNLGRLPSSKNFNFFIGYNEAFWENFRHCLEMLCDSVLCAEGQYVGELKWWNIMCKILLHRYVKPDYTLNCIPWTQLRVAKTFVTPLDSLRHRSVPFAASLLVQVFLIFSKPLNFCNFYARVCVCMLCIATVAF